MSKVLMSAINVLRRDPIACLADIATEARLVSAATPASEVDRLFRVDRRLRSLVVLDANTYSLLSREHVESTLTGRLGYGRGLHARSTAGHLVSESTPSLPGGMSLALAAQQILGLPEGNRDRDVLVLTDHGPRVASVSEIFERLSEDFRYASLHDSLTGLPNRRHLDEWSVALELSDRSLAGIAVLYADLDGFKSVNDTFGHQTGDQVLIDFAERLRHIVRPGDVLARLGGDEFAVLLGDVDDAQALAIAERVVLSASVPFVCDGQLLHVSASVGIVMATEVTAEQGLSQLEVLLRHADGAMIKAKHAGKRQVARLNGHGEAAPIARNAHIRRRLTHAFETRAFALHYQPQLDLATNEATSVEALLRWTDIELGTVSPTEFIPIMELSGDILRIGTRVIQEACAQARIWLDLGIPRRIAVNVSPLQLAARTVVDDVRTALAVHSLPADFIQIEITEGAAINDLPRAIGQLSELREMGISIALDDYGTGYSSLSMLRDLPLNIVKIDKTFIDTIDVSPAAAALVGGIINTAHALGLTVTAEGIERPSQLQILRNLGCDTAQGYLISRPVSPEALPLDFRSWPAQATSSIGSPNAG